MVNDDLQLIVNILGGMEERFNQKFDAIDKKLDAIDERFENTDKVILQCYQDTVQLIEREYNKTEMLIPKVNDLEKWIVDVEVIATRAQAEVAAVKKYLLVNNETLHKC